MTTLRRSTIIFKLWWSAALPHPGGIIRTKRGVPGTPKRTSQTRPRFSGLLQAHTKMTDGWAVSHMPKEETAKLSDDLKAATEKCFGVERQFIENLWTELTPEQQSHVIRPKVVPDHAP